MKIYEFHIPTEKNHYHLFDDDLENNPLIFFHTTPKINLDSIIEKGFRFGQKLQSISFAKNSSSCLAIRGKKATEDWVVIVVEFTSLKDRRYINITPSDIHIFCERIQPTINGHCTIPQEYNFI